MLRNQEDLRLFLSHYGIKGWQADRTAGVPNGRTAGYLRKTNAPKPAQDYLDALARSVGFLSWRELHLPADTGVVRERSRPYGTVLQPVMSSPMGTIKLLGHIGAGTGSNADSDEAGRYPVPIEFASPDASALIVDGPSMQPLIRPGDILVFRDWNWAKHGKINAVVLPEDPRPLVKELSLDDEQQPVLVSFNDEFAPLPVRGATFCGYLIGIIGDSIRIGPILSGIGHDDIVRELQSRLPR